MLSQEQLEAYRRMTPGERLALSLKMTEESWPSLMRGTPEEVDRRFAAINRENDLRNESLLAGFARAVKQ